MPVKRHHPSRDEMVHQNYSRSSELDSSVKYVSIQYSEVKAPIKVILDCHQLICSLLHLLWIVPPRDNGRCSQDPLVLRVKRCKAFKVGQFISDGRRVVVLAHRKLQIACQFEDDIAVDESVTFLYHLSNESIGISIRT